ncbi:hypothetical protein [Phaeocystidibacter luteus]|uniref:Uncharacterized protein n=1 Tax=Phaeocystidibacter luteus TaxID=911197 RepID=A0A6N6RLZ8_9FLAO|nr:hypothetical protein [Phaeocystidibacter luteus]KAB2814573.1 hypothetical protein F8C67_02200 [Phaeocystidibacter luteus]
MKLWNAFSEKRMRLDHLSALDLRIKTLRILEKNEGEQLDLDQIARALVDESAINSESLEDRDRKNFRNRLRRALRALQRYGEVQRKCVTTTINTKKHTYSYVRKG